MCIGLSVIIEKGDFPENVHRVVYVIIEEGDFSENLHRVVCHN